MDKPEFYQRLAEILDVEDVQPENVLKDFDGWDSLAILSVLAMADAKYGVSIKADGDSLGRQRAGPGKLGRSQTEEIGKTDCIHWR